MKFLVLLLLAASLPAQATLITQTTAPGAIAAYDWNPSRTDSLEVTLFSSTDLSLNNSLGNVTVDSYGIFDNGNAWGKAIHIPGLIDGDYIVVVQEPGWYWSSFAIGLHNVDQDLRNWAGEGIIPLFTRRTTGVPGGFATTTAAVPEPGVLGLLGLGLLALRARQRKSGKLAGRFQNCAPNFTAEET